jgi:ferredoxin
MVYEAVSFEAYEPNDASYVFYVQDDPTHAHDLQDDLSHHLLLRAAWLCPSNEKCVF